MLLLIMLTSTHNSQDAHRTVSDTRRPSLIPERTRLEVLCYNSVLIKPKINFKKILRALQGIQNI